MRHATQDFFYELAETGIRAGNYPGDLDPEVARQKIGVLLDQGVRTFVDLTEANEPARGGPLRPYSAELQTAVAERGIDPSSVKHLRLALVDNAVPRSPGQMAAALDAIDAALAGGEQPYVHCWGGVGRTGLVLACHLVRRGMTGADALATVQRAAGTMRNMHPGRHSPETAAQRAYVMDWAQHDRRSVT